MNLSIRSSGPLRPASQPYLAACRAMTLEASDQCVDLPHRPARRDLARPTQAVKRGMLPLMSAWPRSAPACQRQGGQGWLGPARAVFAGGLVSRGAPRLNYQGMLASICVLPKALPPTRRRCFCSKARRKVSFMARTGSRT